MGDFFTNIHVQTSNHQQVLDALRECKVFPLYLSKHASNNWISIYPECTETQDQNVMEQLIVSLSRSLNTGVFGLLVHDSDLLYFFLAENGTVLDRYDSDPGYFSGDDEMNPSGGNLEAIKKYCVSNTTIDELHDLLLTKKAAIDLNAFAQAARGASGNPERLAGMLNDDEIFRGNSLARRFGEKLGLAQMSSSLGYSRLSREKAHAHQVLHFAHPAQNVFQKDSPQGPPRLTKLTGIDMQAAMRTAARTAMRGVLTDGLEQETELTWDTTVLNAGGKATGLRLRLGGADAEYVQEAFAYVSLAPDATAGDAGFQLPDPKDETYWPDIIAFNKINEGKAWSAELPTFKLDERINVKIGLVTTKPGKNMLRLDVEPMDPKGTSDAKFSIVLNAPESKDYLLSKDAQTVRVGKYKVVLPPGYNLTVRGANKLPTVLSLLSGFIGDLGIIGMLSAVRPAVSRFNITVSDVNTAKGSKTVAEIVEACRWTRKFRNFQKFPILKETINSINFEYGSYVCPDLRSSGLVACGRNAEHLLVCRFEWNHSADAQEFQAILRSISAST